eukprot:CAMPEP_0176430740 /NCGR_PEP_ID=MMETSP0127-20121128/14418_1 /TAXON_ID=938130 /ORGANISM="Platyophrya macrostoma, Strain WH" /LENGTH=1373 /DNA_ID=CAMNT_0017812657 /DNA_START=12 /DNA_END=4133 /DNA_ORIENTATION=+
MTNTKSKTEDTPQSPTSPSKKPTEKEIPPAAFYKLFRYAGGFDWFLIIIGSIAACGNGLALPFFALVFGDMTNALGGNSGPDVMVDLAKSAMLKFFWVGLGTMGASWISMGSWMIVGERQAIRFREEYFKALLRQEMSWFDKVNPSEFSSKMAGECFAIQSGLGEKVSTFLYSICVVIAGFVVGFIKGWELTLVLCAAIPLLGITGTVYVTTLQKQSSRSSSAYAGAGALAEQALSAIRTVVGLGGEEKEISSYHKALIAVKKQVIRLGICSAFSFGCIYFANGANYCLGFWVGGTFVGNQRMNPVTDAPYTVGDVLTTFFAVTMGAFSISLISPALKAISEAKAAGGKVLAVINRKSEINHEDPSGAKPTSIQGYIKFDNVYFNYPANKEKPVLRGLDLLIEPNQKTALVGESGCGKSTCMQLIERFYDPDSGAVTLDGQPLNTLNVKWLRENIGYVGQEPVLFSTSVRENMKMAKKTATDPEIIAALKQANAWDFLSPEKGSGKGLDTYVGTGGAQLSGGQKQRIAIARAILKNPAILLLDEATSALDRTNEKEIQKTLDELSKGRTTIVIAHRLSTVRNADKIVLFEGGKVSEAGSHDDLIARRGRYYEMQKLQLHPEEHKQAGHKKKDKAHDAHEVQTIRIAAAGEDEANLRPSFSEERPNGSKRHQTHLGGYTDVQLESKQETAVNNFVEVKTTQHEHVKTHTKTDQIQNGQIQDQQDGPHSDPESDPGSPRSDPASPRSGEEKIIVEVKKALTKEEKKEIARKKKEEKKQQDKDKKLVMTKLKKYSKPERCIFYIGLLAAIANGTVFPFYAVVLSRILQVTSNPFSPTFSEDVRFLALMFLVLAFASVTFYGISLSMFTIMAENLTIRVRSDLYHKMLRMHMTWHDDPNNNPGTLSAKLASASTINTLTSTAVGAMLQMNSGFITGMIISFIGSWRVTLVGLALSPIMILSGKLQADFMAGFAAKTDEAYSGSSIFVMESLTNMRTVSALGKEHEILALFSHALEKPKKEALKKGFVSGLMFGISQLGMFFVFGIVFYVGSRFMRDFGLEFKDVYQAVFGIMFATFDMGNVMQLVPDAAKATATAKGLFQILDTESKIDYVSPKGNCKEPIRGDIEFRDVCFKYPTRERLVLDHINFKIHNGSKVALVGPSGCGKSTVIQLLQRFYDVDSGEILIDGRNIQDYDISHLRKHFGTVSQEPVVFNGTIGENIKYNTESATQTDIENAAKLANAHDFITKNDFESHEQEKDAAQGSGYDRKVGSKGSQISGGQKQRIAIARALLRNPNIMLFDEATSALDPNTEQVVQEAIDKVMAERTSVTVAHRISTIKNSNEILVFRDGKIIERGTYDQLNQIQGVFYRLERGILEQ